MVMVWYGNGMVWYKVV